MSGEWIVIQVVRAESGAELFRRVLEGAGIEVRFEEDTAQAFLDDERAEPGALKVMIRAVDLPRAAELLRTKKTQELRFGEPGVG